MTHDPAAPAEATLYCPVCDYNLTGLIENRCPECGQRFDPVELRRRLAEGCEGGKTLPEPLSAAGVILWIVGHVVIVWVVLGLTAAAAEGVILLVAFIISIIAAVNTTRIIIRGMAMARAIREGDVSSWERRAKAMPGWSAFILFVLLFMQYIVPAGVLFAYVMSI